MIKTDYRFPNIGGGKLFESDNFNQTTIIWNVSTCIRAEKRSAGIVIMYD